MASRPSVRVYLKLVGDLPGKGRWLQLANGRPGDAECSAHGLLPISGGASEMGALEQPANAIAANKHARGVQQSFID
jgi:hypothetical protein